MQIVSLIRKTGGDVVGRVCLEIGTGWRPFLPMCLRMAGARRTITLDVNPWLDARYVRETYQAFREHLPRVADRIGVSAEKMETRWLDGEIDYEEMSALLTGCGIDYRCPADAGNTGFPSDSVDFVVTCGVLEHIPPSDLQRIHCECFRVLRPGGLGVHRISVGDHFRCADPSINGANFLQFSDDAWQWYGGSGLAYHNRLRCVQHLDIFKECGFSVVHEDVRMDTEALDAIHTGRLRVAPRFRAFTPEELAADFLKVIVVKPR
ncbi:MAG: class I SAM-dependent methyltransferase [bacterium]